VGRFGWQSSTCDVATFVRTALHHELGIETLPRSRREISEVDVAALTAFVRALPPPSKPTSDEGLEVFERTLCARCHAPVTGTAPVAGTPVEVRGYTDLLLHEMGAGPRHREQDSRTEFRTPPLWGIGAAGPPYLHDGSAATLEQAILRHAGEAEGSVRRYAALRAAERERLLRFVRTR
jgi:CxxC motif-containing protein (DUF1111 family)